MNTIRSPLINIRSVFSCAGEVLRYALIFLLAVLCCGIEEVRTAHRSPWQNPFVERCIGTLRRELLNHVIVLSLSHVERLLQAFIKEYYHVARPHQGLDGGTPMRQTTPREISGPSKLVSIPVLGGLHHTYIRVAA